MPPADALLAVGRPLLDDRGRERLRAHVTEAVRRARRAGRCLAAVTVALPASADPTAIVVASRRAGEDWFCFEQPDRDGFALAALGCVAALDDRGPGPLRAGRARAGASWPPSAVATTTAARRGPVAVGGFAFAPDGGRTPPWAGYAPASLHVPEVAIARRGGDVAR